MARTKQNDPSKTVDLPVLGEEGDTCEQCGSVLATDQRYCLNCGARRGESRVDYEQRLAANGAQPTLNGAAPAAQGASGQWTPALAIGAIALLGIMLLLGVLIGKNNNNKTQTVAAQGTTTTAAAATAPTTSTPTTATTAAAKTPPAGGGTAAGQGNVDKGGSGNTSGIATANTNASEVQNAKNGPGQVATGGQHAALDPNGQAGGGSGAVCIGGC